MKKDIIGSGFLKYANVLLFLSVITISSRFGLYKEVTMTALRPSSESLNTNYPFIFRWVERPAGTIHALNRGCKVTTPKSDRFILESNWMFELKLKKCLSCTCFQAHHSVLWLSWVFPTGFTTWLHWFDLHCILCLLFRLTLQTSWHSSPSSRATACSQATSTKPRDKPFSL